MKAPDKKIQISVDGKIIKTEHINRGYPRKVFYLEHEDIAAELAQGKRTQQAEAEKLRRAADAIFEEAFKYIEALAKVDISLADALIIDIYSRFAISCEVNLGAGTNMKTLEERAATFYFAWQDAIDFVRERAGDGYAQFLTDTCKSTDTTYCQGHIAPEVRTKAALRFFRTQVKEAAKEAQRELSPEGQAIFDALEAASAALDKCAEDGGPDEAETADRIMEEAETPLDALALRDPEESTRIVKRSRYFEGAIGEYEIYLGKDVIIPRPWLKALDTPEKRQVFVTAYNQYTPSETIKAEGCTITISDKADFYDAAWKAVNEYTERGGNPANAK